MTSRGDSVFFLPWEGSAYRSGERILVLGESHYTDGAADPELTRRVVRAYVEGRRLRRFFTSIARTIVAAPLSTKHCRNLWQSMAFYNFVQMSVGTRPRDRPTGQMWIDAHRPFLQVLDDLAPRYVLVAGKGLWNNLPSAQAWTLARADGTRWPGRAYPSPSGARILATYIHHPSSNAFSWKKWTDVAAALRSGH